jgi:glycosyltransferase involved in cell wall biosynthesis
VRIAIIHEDLSVKGGAENLIIWYANDLVRRGYDVTLFTSKFDRKIWRGEYIRNLTVRVEKAFQFTRNPLKYEIFGRMALRITAEYDLIIVHNWLNSSLSVAFRHRTRKQKWVWFCEEPPRFIYYKEIDSELLPQYINHAYFEPHQGIKIILNHVVRQLLVFLKILDRLYVKRAFDKIIVNSEFTAKNVKRIYNLEPSIAHLGIGGHYVTDHYANMKQKHQCDFMFFYSGRIDASKNLKRIIVAFANLKASVNYKLVIAGKGVLKDYISRKVSVLNLQDKVKLVGHVSDEDLVSYYNSADLMVYLPINEPFGLVPIEALACGKPSLVSNIGGPSETIVENVTGFYANPLDVDDISRKLEYIIEHREVLASMKDACKKAYLTRFTLEKGVDRFLKALI